jgi:hypothetical protein
MKKIFLLLAVIAINFISYGQDGFQAQKAEMKPSDLRGNVGLFQKACSNTLDISTPTNWVPVGNVPISVGAFYNHANWIALTNPQTTTRFKRKIYIGRAGTYKVSVKGMGDNRMVLNVDAPPANQVFDRDITNASGFNTPTSATIDVELTCGIHELNVTLTNYQSSAGFYLDGTISSKEGCVSDEKIACEVIKEVCRCPKGWLSNTSNKEGDITTDGQCKKMVCGPLDIKPAIKNMGFEGGFFWDNYVYAAGTKANGGAPICKKEWVVEGVNPNTKAGEGRGEK